MNKRIIVNLHGGLGNQLFQYAFARSLNLSFGFKIEFNTDFFYKNFRNQTNREIGLHFFNIDFTETRITYFQRLITHKSITYLIPKILHNNFNEKELDFIFFNKVKFKKINFFNGYWQNYNYFNSIKKIIKTDFSLDHNLINLDYKDLNEITNSNSLCIHVRRTDFIGTNHDIIGKNYYKKSYDKINNLKINNLKKFIFSDDINWCKKNLDFILNPIFCNYSMINDFHLMSLCKFFIIPNSTFSWWAAYLSNYENKIVISPSRWDKNDLDKRKNLLPNNWLTIDV